MTDLENLISNAGGTPSAFTKDTPMGTVHGGVVTDVAVRQVRDFDNGDPEFWEDGSPKQQVAIIVQTDLRDPTKPDDDGKRGIYVKWWGDQRKALVDAVKAAGDSDVRVGGQFFAQYVTEKPNEKNPRLNPSKVYAYKYIKPATGLDFSAIGTVAPAVAPVAVAPPAAFPPVVAPAVVAPPVATPVAAAPAAVAAPPGEDPVAKARQFIALGMTDAEVAGATGLAVEVITAIRQAPAA